MKRFFLAFILIIVAGCSPSSPNKETLVKIDKYSMSSEDFVNELNAMSGFQRAGKTKEELLEEIIQKKLLLLEAQKEGLDKEPPFMKMIEHFWEQSLLRAIIENKMKEFVTTPRITKDEREKVNKRFEEWMSSLRKKARVYVNKKALDKIAIPAEE